MRWPSPRPPTPRNGATGWGKLYRWEADYYDWKMQMIGSVAVFVAVFVVGCFLLVAYLLTRGMD